jgi:hypothetical protein
MKCSFAAWSRRSDGIVDTGVLKDAIIIEDKS